MMIRIRARSKLPRARSPAILSALTASHGARHDDAEFCGRRNLPRQDADKLVEVVQPLADRQVQLPHGRPEERFRIVARPRCEERARARVIRISSYMAPI